jgi:WS/DGAT/MGAT family acyltransferase
MSQRLGREIAPPLRDMERMRGADAYFLHEESRTRHMHTLKIVVVDPSTAHEKLTFERVRIGASRAMPHLAAFRRRPLRMPLGIGHPAWLDAPWIDPNYHFRHQVLPIGAGHEALDELVGRIASEPLDESRPLWQLYFVEGLPQGHVAYLVKLHHAVADGAASAELVARVLQTTPDPIVLPPAVAQANEAVPAKGRLLAGSVRRELARQRDLPGLLRRSVRAIRSGVRWHKGHETGPTRPFAGPMTRFNRPLTPNRIYRHVTLPLGELKAVKNAFDANLNDVYLALAGGAIHRYLVSHDEIPDAPATAAIPVSVRRPENDPTFGNAVAQWFASTGSDLEDPVERLHAVVESARAARELFASRDSRLAVDWLDYWPLRWIYLDAFQRVAAALLRRPSFTVIVSNVCGPREPLYSDGSRVVALRSMGPLALQQGLNFTAWSYQDDFTVGLHACREHLTDLGVLADAMREELTALGEAAAAQRSPAS